MVLQDLGGLGSALSVRNEIGRLGKTWEDLQDLPRLSAFTRATLDVHHGSLPHSPSGIRRRHQRPLD